MSERTDTDFLLHILETCKGRQPFCHGCHGKRDYTMTLTDEDRKNLTENS